VSPLRLLARLSGRLLFRLGMRWLVLQLVGRLAVELEAYARDRLPAPIRRVVSRLPGGAKSAGGSVLVAGRVSRRVASGAGRARSARARIRDETDASLRGLRARYLAGTVGPEAATDSLLDVRAAARASEDPDPHSAVPAPVPPGRRRARRRRVPPVNRVRRTYHRAPEPWD
jgi:hypothetical protein